MSESIETPSPQETAERPLEDIIAVGDGSAPTREASAPARRVRTPRAPGNKEGAVERPRRVAKPRVSRKAAAESAGTDSDTEGADAGAAPDDSRRSNSASDSNGNQTTAQLSSEQISSETNEARRTEMGATNGASGNDTPRPDNGARGQDSQSTNYGVNAETGNPIRSAFRPPRPGNGSQDAATEENGDGTASAQSSQRSGSRNAGRGGARPEKYSGRNRPSGERPDTSRRRKPTVAPRGPLASNSVANPDSGARTNTPNGNRNPRQDPNRSRDPNRSADPNRNRDVNRSRDPNRSADVNRSADPNRNRDGDRNRDPNRTGDTSGRRPQRTNREPSGSGRAPAAIRSPQPSLSSVEVQAVRGVLEIRPDGNGFLRTRENWTPDASDVSVPAALIQANRLRAGQEVIGAARPSGRSGTLVSVLSAEGLPPDRVGNMARFSTLEAEIPYERMRLETTAEAVGPRLIDLLAPLGKGQRGLIVAPPQAGKTRLLRDIANSVATNHPKTELFILLIDERPEEVTELRSLRLGQVIASTFDESRSGQLAAAELALERMQRLVESGKDVFLLIDSLTRLARASNLAVRGTGRSLSGGLDPAALAFPRRLFGAARATRDAGNLTILATALVETGSVMDEFVFQEFKGTGNWEVKLDRKLAQRRVFPAIDINASSTRREELLYTPQELQATTKLRQYLHKFSQQSEARSERLVWLLTRTRSNAELLSLVDRL